MGPVLSMMSSAGGAVLGALSSGGEAIADEADENKHYLCLPLIAPFVLLAAVIMIGWSEKRSVCRAKAIDQGRDAAVKISDCSNANVGNGELVFFNCDLNPSGLVPSTLGLSTASDINVAFPGVCLKTASTVYTCKETASTSPAPCPSPCPSPAPPPVTTYTYEKAWSTSVNTATFNDLTAARSACGLGTTVTSNSAWASGAPTSSTVYADSVKAGAWTITSNLGLIACDTALSAACNDRLSGVACADTSTWASDGTGSWTKENAGTFKKGTGSTVGDYRVVLTGNNWASAGVTGLGLNDGGTLKEWTADSDWLCDGDKLYEFSLGTKSLDEQFSDMESANTGLTWFLRIFGLLLLWGGFFCCLGPLVFVAEMVDLIPFIGDFVSDLMYYVIVAVSCMPACACCLFVTAICWMAMRPLIGVPCFLLSLLLFGIFGFASYRNKEKVKADPEKSKSRKRPSQVDGAVVVGSPVQTQMDTE